MTQASGTRVRHYAPRPRLAPTQSAGLGPTSGSVTVSLIACCTLSTSCLHGTFGQAGKERLRRRRFWPSPTRPAEKPRRLRLKVSRGEGVAGGPSWMRHAVEAWGYTHHRAAAALRKQWNIWQRDGERPFHFKAAPDCGKRCAKKERRKIRNALGSLESPSLPPHSEYMGRETAA